jgi:arsenite transporter
MSTAPQAHAATPVTKKLNLFERYLTLWVGLCMGVGIAVGRRAPVVVSGLRDMEFGRGSHVNLPIAVLIWLVKPFSMALFAWFFFRHVFSHWITPGEANQYIAGTIILAAAPCTAMVFVWSHLTDGDPAYTLVQVSLNDVIMLFLFAPIVRFLVAGASNLQVPFRVLLCSVVAFIVIPLALGSLLRHWLIAMRGTEWFERRLLPSLAPVTISALLATLILIFAFQADNISGRHFHVLLIAVPILIQVYFNSGLAYGLMYWLKVPYAVAAPGALIGASNFFELAVATSISLFGPASGAALATVVGVLVEVPVMLSVCGACKRTRGWFSWELAVNTTSD